MIVIIAIVTSSRSERTNRDSNYRNSNTSSRSERTNRDSNYCNSNQ